MSLSSDWMGKINAILIYNQLQRSLLACFVRCYERRVGSEIFKKEKQFIDKQDTNKLVRKLASLLSIMMIFMIEFMYWYFMCILKYNKRTQTA